MEIDRNNAKIQLTRFDFLYLKICKSLGFLIIEQVPLSLKKKIKISFEILWSVFLAAISTITILDIVITDIINFAYFIYSKLSAF